MAYQPKSYKKFVATAATATLVASAIAPVAFADSSKFTDVSAKYKDAVDFVVSKGANGLTATSFGVDANIKRVDAAVLLVNVLGLDIEAAPASGLTDVPQRAVKHINALKAAGITSGKTPTTFDPDAQITRGELAIWISKAFKLEGSNTTAFKDVSSNYASAVSALVAAGITQGTSETTFGTTANAKRGDYAIFLQRAAQGGVETPAPAELAITNVSVLSEDGRYLAVELNKAITSVDKNQFSIRATGSGARVGIESAKLSADGKTVELVAYDAGDFDYEIERGKEYTVTFTADDKTISYNFERPQYLDDRNDARVIAVDAEDKSFEVDFVLNGAAGKVSIEVPEGIEFDYEEALGAEIKVWFTGDDKLMQFEIIGSGKVFYDAFEINEDNEIELETADKEYDLATNVEYHFNGEKQAVGSLVDGVKADYAKIVLNDKGDVAYVYAYNLPELIVVESVNGTEVEGLGDVDADFEDFVIVKEGKTIKVSDLQAGDAVYYNGSADNSIGEEGYAVVYNNKITGTIDNVYDEELVVDGKKYDLFFNYIDEDGELQTSFNYDDAEDYEGSEVTIFVDYKGDIQLLTGISETEVGNDVGALLTASAQVYPDNKNELAIELEYVTQAGEEKLADVYFKSLDSITVDGFKYKIEQDEDENKDYRVVEGDEENQFEIYSNTDESDEPKPLATVTLEDNTPIIVTTDDAGKITDLEVLSSATLSEEIEPGDSNAKTEDGSKKLNKDTVIFVAEDAAGTDPEDIKVYQFGDINFDIDAATVYYDEDGNVEFLVIQETVASSTEDYIAVVDDFSTRDGEITRLVAFVGGKKVTYTVDSVPVIEPSTNLADGKFVKIEVDGDGVVQDIYLPENDKFTRNWYLLNEQGATGITSTKFVLDSKTYQKGENFQIIDATGKLEVETSLSAIEGKKFHVILDGDRSQFVSTIIILGDEDEKEVVDFTDLEALIEDAKELTGADYTSASWTALETALEAAEAVEEDEDATQDDVDGALAELQDAIGKLVEVITYTTSDSSATALTLTFSDSVATGTSLSTTGSTATATATVSGTGTIVTISVDPAATEGQTVIVPLTVNGETVNVTLTYTTEGTWSVTEGSDALEEEA